jgi:hypothetical protein
MTHELAETARVETRDTLLLGPERRQTGRLEAVRRIEIDVDPAAIVTQPVPEARLAAGGHAGDE